MLDRTWRGGGGGGWGRWKVKGGIRVWLLLRCYNRPGWGGGDPAPLCPPPPEIRFRIPVPGRGVFPSARPSSLPVGAGLKREARRWQPCQAAGGGLPQGRAERLRAPAAPPGSGTAPPPPPPPAPRASASPPPAGSCAPQSRYQAADTRGFDGLQSTLACRCEDFVKIKTLT